MTTDILSFPVKPEKGALPAPGRYRDQPAHGRENGQEVRRQPRREIETLVIHGFLHLCGHDHEKDHGEMLELQAQLERELLETKNPCP